MRGKLLTAACPLFFKMDGLFLLNTILIVVYWIVIISCIGVIMSENRNPIRSLAWIIALLALPGVGLVFYLFFGRSLKGLHLISRHNRRRLLKKYNMPQVTLSDIGLSDAERQLVKLAYSLIKTPLTVNNRIEIFTRGDEKFAALMSDLRSAQRSIYLQYYIFADDHLGNEVAQLLMEKARQGVDVKVIYDHVGSLSSKKRFFRRMSEAGVEVHPFFKVTFRHLANRVNWRNHRKLVIIDNKIGYIGGMNIADRYLRGTEDGGVWRDTHMRVEGDILGPLLYSFAVDWHFLKAPESLLPLQVAANPLRNNCGLQLISDGPTHIWDNMSLCYQKAISSARKSIFIQTPYFLPPEALLNALEAAALSKVDVRVMIPRRSDSKLLQFASYSYITRCLKSGIKVYLYEPGMLHAKMMTIDDNFCTAGSVNFDFRSFENNFEGNLLIYDAQTNRTLRDTFFEDMQQCSKIKYADWQKRPVLQRSFESILRLLAPIL